MSPQKGKLYAAREIGVSGLNEIKVHDYIQKVRKEVKSGKKPYNLLFQNCSSVVAGALLAGAKKSFADDMKGKLSRLSKTFDFMSTFAGMRDGLVDQNKVEQHLLSTNSLFSNMPSVGVQTPMSIWEFSQSLNN